MSQGIPLCNLWMVSGSRDHLACVVSRLLVCIFSVSWGQSCLLMVFGGWLVYSFLVQCFVWFSCLSLYLGQIVLVFLVFNCFVPTLF